MVCSDRFRAYTGWRRIIHHLSQCEYIRNGVLSKPKRVAKYLLHGPLRAVGVPRTRMQQERRGVAENAVVDVRVFNDRVRVVPFAVYDEAYSYGGGEEEDIAK